MREDLQIKYDRLPEHYKALVDNWQHDIVLHRDSLNFFAGALSRGRLANLLHAGEGPETFRIGNKKASYAIELADWLYRRSDKEEQDKLEQEMQSYMTKMQQNPPQAIFGEG